MAKKKQAKRGARAKRRRVERGRARKTLSFSKNPEAQEMYLTALERYGTAKAASHYCGYCLASITKFAVEDLEFAKREQQIRELRHRINRKLLEDAAWNRAINGWRDPVFYEGVVCGYKRVYSVPLMIFMLKAWDRNRYLFDSFGDLSPEEQAAEARKLVRESKALFQGEVEESEPEQKKGGTA